MRNSLTSSTALLLAALALPAMGVPAFAQGTATGAASPAPALNAAPSDAGVGTPPGPRAGQQRGHRWSPEQRAERVEARIAHLHEEIGITAAQEPQWKTFAQVMRDNAARMAKGFETRGSHLSAMSAAQNMQSYADMAVQHAQDIQRLAMAFQSVYDSLSPSQKTAADTLFRARQDRQHQRGRHMKGATGNPMPGAATPAKP